jgi:hypothetical protein
MPNIAKRPDGRWRARYRDDAGHEHARHFSRRLDAQRWIDEVTASIVTGQYVDPKAGRVTFQDYAEGWRLAQVHRPTSAAHIETMLRRHAYPVFGGRPMPSILPSEVQSWVRLLGTNDKAAGRQALAPSTIQVVHAVVSSIFRSAIRGPEAHGEPL